MPAVTNDGFRRLRIESNAGAIQGVIVADEQLDTLTLIAGTGISFTPSENNDSLTINTVGSVNTAGLNDILFNGSTSTFGMTVGSVTVDDVVINNNAITVDHASNNLTLTTTGTGVVIASKDLQTHNIIPAADITYDLGSPSYRFKDLYLSGSTIYLGSASISSSGSAITLPAGTTIAGTSVVDSVIPTQTDNTNKFLRTNGSTLYWADIPSQFPDQTGANGKYLKSNGSTASWSLISVTASDVGLGNVTNESKATMFTNPTFTGTVNGVTSTHVGLGNVTNESKATMFTEPTFTGTVSIEKAITPFSIGDYSSLSSYTFPITNADGDLRFNPTGTACTFINSASKSIVKATLSTAWDLSSITGTQTASMSSLFSTQSIEKGHYWKPDGTAFFIISSYFTRTIEQINVSTPWDISTITSKTSGFTLLGSPMQFTFSSDGTTLIINSSNGAQFTSYSLLGPWDITEGQATSKTFTSLSNIGFYPGGFDFNDDGTKMFIFGNTRFLYVFDLPTPWAINSIDDSLIIQSINFSANVSSLYVGGFVWKPDGNQFYLTTTINGTDYTKAEQFDIGLSGGGVILPGTLNVLGTITNANFTGSLSLPNGVNEFVYFGSDTSGGFMQSSGNATDSTLTIGGGGDFNNFSSIVLGQKRAIVQGILSTNRSTEFYYLRTGATGVEDHNYITSSIHYHTDVAGAFTANWINVIASSYTEAIVLTLIIEQGATAYLPTFTLEGVSKTVKWLGGTQPTPNANKIDVISYTLFRANDSWTTVLGSLSTYG